MAYRYLLNIHLVSDLISLCVICEMGLRLQHLTVNSFQLSSCVLFSLSGCCTSVRKPIVTSLESATTNSSHFVKLYHCPTSELELSQFWCAIKCLMLPLWEKHYILFICSLNMLFPRIFPTLTHTSVWEHESRVDKVWVCSLKRF